MSWAARRRLLIVATIGIFVVIVLALVSYKSFYHAPSCVDGVQNQGEQGIDCGGPCAYLCQSQVEAPVVRFIQVFAPQPGRAAAIAYIDNPNQAASAQAVQYQIVFYAADHTFAAPSQEGTIDLPPGATVPVFIPAIDSGKSTVTAAFLTLDPVSIHWQTGKDMRIVPGIGDESVSGASTTPRITATLMNPSTTTLSSVRVVVVAYDASSNVIAASQTIVPSIPGQGSAVATFTWNAPFSASVARIEVLPVIPLSP